MQIETTSTSPSNIALIKYWGKHGLQLPRNPSLSFTLSVCHTKMIMRLETGVPHAVTVQYDGKPRVEFLPKITNFLKRIRDDFSWLSAARIDIDSVNTFPHGAGIASSASAMSAMALCLMDLDDKINGRSGEHDVQWWQKASHIARLGSGSACRSVFPVASIWGRMDGISQSSDEYAIPWKDEIHPVFQSYRDTVLIVSAAEKSVSSTAGHTLMDELPYAESRYAEARNNLSRLIDCMKSDQHLETFMEIVETEALQLHALMMSGHKPFILMEPNTLSIIREVWRFRKEANIPVCFTLDAGPNVHLLYREEDTDTLRPWIESVLLPYCTGQQKIDDRVA